MIILPGDVALIGNLVFEIQEDKLADRYTDVDDCEQSNILSSRTSSEDSATVAILEDSSYTEYIDDVVRWSSHM